MKTFALLLGLIAIMIWSSDPSISFKPFKLSFGNGYYTVAILLVVIALGLAKYQGKKEREKQVMDVVEKMIKDDEL